MDYRQRISRNNVIMSPLRMAEIGSLSLLGYGGSLTKAYFWPMSIDQQKTDKITQYHWETI